MKLFSTLCGLMCGYSFVLAVNDLISYTVSARTVCCCKSTVSNTINNRKNYLYLMDAILLIIMHHFVCLKKNT